MSAWPWPSSETTAKVIPAFVLALQGADDVTKGRKVNAGQMRYSYADLADVLEAVKPLLVANGLAITQAAASDGVHTIVMHSSGEWLAFPPLEVKTGQNTPQGQGSALTYARRYSLLGVLGIATEDDDGQAAKPAARQEITRPEPLASANQIKALGTRFSAAGYKDRGERLAYVIKTVGREVASSKELTTREAGLVLNRLNEDHDSELVSA